MKVGDKVRTPRGSGKIRRINPITNMVRVELSSGRMVIISMSRMQLAVLLKKKDDNSWQFKVMNSGQIDWNLLIEDLDKDKPMQLIEIGDRRYVSVHTSLIKKADDKGISLPAGLTHEVNGNDDTIFITPCQFSEWVDWAIRVRSAKWPDNLRRPVTIKVTMPNV